MILKIPIAEKRVFQSMKNEEEYESYWLIIPDFALEPNQIHVITDNIGEID